MANGLAMSSAFWEEEDRIVRAHELEAILLGREIDDNPADIRCDSCGCHVSFVRSFELHKNDPERRRTRRAFFRLRPGSNHGADCAYTPRAQARIIVARARNVEGMVDPFEGDDQDLKFRLNILVERLRQRREEAARLGPPGAAAGQPSPPAERVRIERIWTDRWIEPYIRSAVDLARLWHEFSDRANKAELANEITIVDGRRDVPWLDFVYDDDRYSILLRRIINASKEKRLLEHSVALIVHTKVFKAFENNETGYINCFWQQIEDDANKLTRIGPQLFGAATLLRRIQPGTDYVVFGTPRRVSVMDPPYKPQVNGANVRYFNIGIDLYSPVQFAPLHL